MTPQSIHQHHALSLPSNGLPILTSLSLFLRLSTLYSTLKFLSLEVALAEAMPLHVLHVKVFT